MRSFALVFSLVLVLLSAFHSPRALADDGPITDGVAWLVAHQDASGLWGTDKATPFRDATAVMSVLATQDVDATVITAGLDAINAASVTSVDYLARKVMAITSVGGGVAPAQQVEALAEKQNDDGGWGYNVGYESNVLDTALSLEALRSASYSEMTKLQMGVNYLALSANPDGGWAFVAGDSSRVFYTAQVVNTLARLRGDLDVTAQIAAGVGWLRTQEHADGGFGTGVAGNPYETGLALAALIKGVPSAPEVAGAQNYLETTQLADGSWRTDSYCTAMALFGLMHVAPDLAIGAADIVLSNPAPSDSEMVVVTATVHNIGARSAQNILVRIFAGHPDQGGVQLGADQTIPSLAAGGAAPVQVNWFTYGYAGDNSIYVLVDPLNGISEVDKLNNTAMKPVHVFYPPDLTISSIVFTPAEPEPLEPVTISTTVTNVGELRANNVRLQVWDGVPGGGGHPLLDPPYNLGSIDPGSQFTLNLNMGGYFAAEGEYSICAVVDPNNQIREIAESNNVRCEDLCVGCQCHSTGRGVALNLLGLPLQPREASTSFTLLPGLPGCDEIDGWDRAAQMWRTAVDIGEGSIIGDDFPIDMLDGFFVRAEDVGMVEFCGMRLIEHGCTALHQGLNMVSLPNEDACYTGYSLIGSINTCTEAHSWNVATQSWLTAIKTGPGQYLGEDFDVRPGQGFFVKVQSAGQWCTATCDTIAQLPDLVVTPDDIYISPNPAQRNQWVTILVNVNNVGATTAVAPRMDIYYGNPGQGGQEMGHIYLPDIPPGEASGFYGSEWSFGITGSKEIWGVADLANEMEEVNEANNRAYRVLQIISEPLASKESDSDLAFVGGTVPHLTLVAQAPRVTSSSAGPPQADTPRVTKVASPAEPTSIAHVTAGNHSSSSVTITWATDVATDGCVHYGATPDLDSTACEQGEFRKVHHVVLDALQSETTYSFKVVSGGLADDNGGNLYSFTTTKPGVGIPSVLYGGVIAEAGGLGVPGIAVTGMVLREQGSSYPLIGLTDSQGQWILNLGNLKDPAGGDAFAYAAGDRFVLGFLDPDGTTEADTVTIAGESPQDCGTRLLQVPSDLTEPSLDVPDLYYLAPNSPNPFSRTTRIAFGLPMSNRVEISVYNVAGQRIAALAGGEYPAGHHVVTWDGKNSEGVSVSSGIYFYQLRANGFEQVRRMFILR